MGIIASIIGIVATVGTTAYGVVKGEQQSRQADAAVNAQLEQQKAMQKQLEQQQAQEQQKSQQQAQQEQQRQRAISSGYQNAQGQTTFTSPLGLPGGASTTNKTLLGI